MAHESFLVFLEKASQEPALQEQLKGAVDAEAVASVAHAAGCINVSAEQVSAFLADVASQQAANGDQDLEGVTGGLSKGAKIGIGVGASVVAAGIAGGAYYAMQPGARAPEVASSGSFVDLGSSHRTASVSDSESGLPYRSILPDSGFSVDSNVSFGDVWDSYRSE